MRGPYLKKINILAMFICLLTAFGLLSTTVPGTAAADEINFEVSVESNVIYLGRSSQLNLTFQGSRDIPRPVLQGIDGFQVQYIGPSTRMSIVNGRMSSSVIHVYSLIPLKAGKFKIGPFSFEYKGDTYKSNAVTVEVMDRPANAGSRAQGRQKTQTDLKDLVFLLMEAGKTTAYVNEVVPLRIKLYVNSLQMRDIQYPEFAHDGFSAGEFGEPRQYREYKDGINYNVVEFSTRIFGTRPGDFTIGPAKLKGNLTVKRQRSLFDDPFGHDAFSGFLGAYDVSPIEPASGKLRLKILPFPDKEAPDDFKGAVGDFNFSMDVSPKEVKAGDPVTLKMIITGEGNFDTVNSPTLKQHEGFKVYEPQAKQEGSRKVFERILIPLSDDIKEIPGVAFSFFNPTKGEYRTISKKNVAIKVTKPEKQENITIMEAPVSALKRSGRERFGRDIIYIKESPGKFKKRGEYLYNNTTFLLLQAVPLLIFVSVLVMQKRKEKLRTDIRYARRLSAPKKAKKGIREAQQYLNNISTPEFYSSVFKTIREYLGDRFHLPAAGITADVVDDALKTKGISEDMLNRLRDIFKECDMARYAPSEFGKKEMEATFNKLKEVMDYLERQKL
ncbi:MAG TPA: protein BatD [Nitrospirae bacterium]|nr:hypothetical protein BMS3Abin06_00197 [bacterium BMS3Abin06]HDH12176.1 protein BatD [Nitrospirota bacterium]HDZ03116.1 protein BatD [Nitrospirota bacterium]